MTDLPSELWPVMTLRTFGMGEIFFGVSDIFGGFSFAMSLWDSLLAFYTRVIGVQCGLTKFEPLQSTD